MVKEGQGGEGGEGPGNRKLKPQTQGASERHGQLDHCTHTLCTALVQTCRVEKPQTRSSSPQTSASGQPPCGTSRSSAAPLC